MACAQVIIPAQDKYYDCVNNQCTETPGGQYVNDTTCGGACKAATGNNNALIYVGIAIIAGFLLLRKK